MRSRLGLITLSAYLGLALLGCTSKSTDNSNNSGSAGSGSAANTTNTSNGTTTADNANNPPAVEKKKEPIIVPVGTAVTVSLGSALGSKLSQPSQTFNGTVAKDVTVGDAVAIPQGSTIAGTVMDAKPLGKFAGGASLQIRLDSINLNGADLPVQSELKTFSAKG
jgi:type IV secretory pathway VirB10-like protein